MNPKKKKNTVLGMGGVILAFGLIVAAGAMARPAEQERQVPEGEVPPPALATLKALSAGAAITAFAEEIEHGGKFYEGSWQGKSGNVDVRVTEDGAFVEIEEVCPAEEIPRRARAAVEKEAGIDAKIVWERKTSITYEAHYQRDGKTREILLTPDGRQLAEEEEDDEDKGEAD
jgi:hypothetical protein